MPLESAAVSESSLPLANASSLRSMVQAVIADARAPRTVRNACHCLMVAIERNDHALVDESLISFERAAKRVRYALPPSSPRPNEPER